MSADTQKLTMSNSLSSSRFWRRISPSCLGRTFTSYTEELFLSLTPMKRWLSSKVSPWPASKAYSWRKIFSTTNGLRKDSRKWKRSNAVTTFSSWSLILWFSWGMRSSIMSTINLQWWKASLSKINWKSPIFFSRYSSLGFGVSQFLKEKNTKFLTLSTNSIIGS